MAHYRDSLHMQNEIDIEFDDNGVMIPQEELRESRRKRGLCVNCKQKLYKIRPFPLGNQPLTIPSKVYKGRCLTCNPLPDQIASVNAAAAAARKLKSKYLLQKQHQNRVSSIGSFVPSPPPSAHPSPNKPLRPSIASALPPQAIPESKTVDEPPRQLNNSLRTSTRTALLPQNRHSSRRLNNSCTSINEENEEEEKVPFENHSNVAQSHQTEEAYDTSGVNKTTNDTKPVGNRRDMMKMYKITPDKSHDNYGNSVNSAIGMSVRKLECTTSVDEIVSEMKSNPGVLAIQTESCRRLGSLTLSEQDRKFVADQGGLQRIIDTMRYHPKDKTVQESSCRALWNLSAAVENQKIIAESGGITAIIQAMEFFKKEPGVQEKAIAALSNLGATEENQVIILEEGGVKAIVDAMNDNLEDINVQEKGCAAITNLASRSKALKKGISEARGIDAIIFAMMFHECDPELQEKALRAIRNMCANDDQNKKLVAQADGISYVICAMQNHRDDVGVQEQGCWTLSNLAVDKENKVFIGRHGGIDCIILAMWVHSPLPAVCEWACRALWTLSVDSRNKAIIAEVGGIPAVVHVMRQHQDKAAVQEKGCGVFANLAANSDENKVSIVDQEGLDVIIMAMMLHGDKKAVIERACTALRKITCERNLQSMQAYGVPGALRNAKNNFPDECGSKVDQILNYLSSGSVD